MLKHNICFFLNVSLLGFPAIWSRRFAGLFFLPGYDNCSNIKVELVDIDILPD
jgi:hypothetical protein